MYICCSSDYSSGKFFRQQHKALCCSNGFTFCRYLVVVSSSATLFALYTGFLKTDRSLEYACIYCKVAASAYNTYVATNCCMFANCKFVYWQMPQSIYLRASPCWMRNATVWEKTKAQNYLCTYVNIFVCLHVVSRTQ